MKTSGAGFAVDEDGVTTVARAEQFKALSHPMRHRLLFALGQGQATISQLAAALGSNKGNIAHHLKVLREAGLVESSRRGTWAFYRLVPEAIRELRDTLGGA